MLQIDPPAGFGEAVLLEVLAVDAPALTVGQWMTNRKPTGPPSRDIPEKNLPHLRLRDEVLGILHFIENHRRSVHSDSGHHFLRENAPALFLADGHYKFNFTYRALCVCL